MPFSGRDAVVLCVLVCCVPLQYWFTKTSPSTPEQRSAVVYQLVEQARAFAARWFTMDSWREWLRQMFIKHMANDYSQWYLLDDDKPLGECPAVEVWHYRSPHGTFGMSPKPRLEHPKEVKWRIGQVVKHHSFGYKGVIIGWDLKAKAPQEWILSQHKENLHWRDQPNYTLLVDTDGRKIPQIAYVPQENITPLINEEVKHPDLHHYFDDFDGAQYIPCPWLRAVYPSD
ncbi:uncharacterized protein LOC135089050 isoform X1 [Scylla paramamosain]|uniref:uncharacterized protein LOC135089050 isoform X1 n=1 Tax=Scylla paramamosain TaxID=85552 RepID=UPI003082FB0F